MLCPEGLVQTVKCGEGPEQVRKAQGREAIAGRSAMRPKHKEQPGGIWEKCSGRWDQRP